MFDNSNIEIMIQLKDIYRYYKNKFECTYILKNINLQITQGEFISIMGPSGAGKSTLLNIIGMLDNLNEGEYNFMDKPIGNLKEKHKADYHREYIGFIFQAFHLR